MNIRLSLMLFIIISVSIAGCRTSSEKPGLEPLKTVKHVELTSYLGDWYEIARIPAWFQKGCTASSASYSLRKDGRIDVLNRCLKGTLSGKEREARGIARIEDTSSNARLKVSFFRPFWGDYWIIELDPAYAFAVVGHPSRDYLWILSRCPVMDTATYSALLEKIRNHGYDIERIVRTDQPESASCREVPQKQ